MTTTTNKLMAYEMHINNQMNAIKMAYDMGLIDKETARARMQIVNKRLTKLDGFYDEFNKMDED